MSQYQIDFTEIQQFAKNLEGKAPSTIKKAMKDSLFGIGKSDIDRFRTKVLPSAFHLTSKGTVKAFSFHLFNGDTALSEFTRAKWGAIFENGGIVRPNKAKNLLIIADAGLSGSGRLKYAKNAIQNMIESGEADIITPRGRSPFVVRHIAGRGKYQKGQRDEIIAFLRPSITQKKRYSFFKNSDDNSAYHEEILNKVGEQALKSF